MAKGWTLISDKRFPSRRQALDGTFQFQNLKNINI
jgi:hypothetical protein